MSNTVKRLSSFPFIVSVSDILIPPNIYHSAFEKLLSNENKIS